MIYHEIDELTVGKYSSCSRFNISTCFCLNNLNTLQLGLTKLDGDIWYRYPSLDNQSLNVFIEDNAKSLDDEVILEENDETNEDTLEIDNFSTFGEDTEG